jgi:hypothetical protein
MISIYNSTLNSGKTEWANDLNFCTQVIGLNLHQMEQTGICVSFTIPLPQISSGMGVPDQFSAIQRQFNAFYEWSLH